MERLIQVRIFTGGACQGEVLASGEPLSFWGGYQQETGEIIDRRHPLSGEIACGKILAVPFSRGSSTTTAVLLEAIRNEKAPLAILTRGLDRFFVLASIVADELYGKPITVAGLAEEDFPLLSSGQRAEIHADGTLKIKSG